MNDKLFIPQSVLDKWVESGKVTFNDSVLCLLKEQRSYTLTPAVRFMALVAGDDSQQLLTKIRTLQKLEEMGGEHMSDSVIMGDTAYTVQEGFIGVVLADAEVASVAESTGPHQLGETAPAAAHSPAVPASAASSSTHTAASAAVDVAPPPPVDIHAFEIPAMPTASLAAAPPPTPAAASAPAKEASSVASSLAQASGDTSKEQSSDADMLTKFLLNNLNF